MNGKVWHDFLLAARIGGGSDTRECAGRKIQTPNFNVQRSSNIQAARRWLPVISISVRQMFYSEPPEGGVAQV
jgi:hypothetical protein